MNSREVMMNRDSSIFVAGHRGLVGSAIMRQLEAHGFGKIIVRTHAELELKRQAEVEDFFMAERPEYVFLAAARVGGIVANNTYPADFIYDNLAVQCNVIHSAHLAGVKKLLFLGSSCIYPKFAPQPMREEHLLTGELEPTNEPYAVSKIAGIKMCQSYNRQYGANYISLMPTNLYGPGDNFDLETSHVLPALIRKFHDAKLSGGEVTLWGTGSPKREFLHVDDFAAASVFLMQNYDHGEIINVGSGSDITIRAVAEMVKDIVGYQGQVHWDSSKPDGTPRKLLDVDRLRALGWSPRISLKDGMRSTYQWFLEHYETARM